MLHGDLRVLPAFAAQLASQLDWLEHAMAVPEMSRSVRARMLLHDSGTLPDSLLSASASTWRLVSTLQEGGRVPVKRLPFRIKPSSFVRLETTSGSTPTSGLS